jgi:predicted signal transduction protein with EAL and GGDEF domain
LNGVVGVLAMYHSGQDAFTPDHLRILLAVASKVALSVENALKYQQAESSATTDFLTGLPNARSLFVHLAQEVARCRRMKTSLAVMVCDIDGLKKINDSFGHLEGRQAAARVQHAAEGRLPRLRLRGADGRRRVCGHGARTHSGSRRGKDRSA